MCDFRSSKSKISLKHKKFVGSFGRICYFRSSKFKIFLAKHKNLLGILGEINDFWSSKPHNFFAKTKNLLDFFSEIYDFRLSKPQNFLARALSARSRIILNHFHKLLAFKSRFSKIFCSRAFARSQSWDCESIGFHSICERAKAREPNILKISF